MHRPDQQMVKSAKELHINEEAPLLMGSPSFLLAFPWASICSRSKTYKLESLVALQRESIHQVAGLVLAIW